MTTTTTTTGGTDNHHQKNKTLLYSNNNASHHSKQVWLGGPNTGLPFWLESLLSWSLAISCLSVALYHWMKQLLLVGFPKIRSPVIPIPLTTHSRQEHSHVSALERYQQLTNVLEQLIRNKRISEWSDDDLVQAVHTNHVVRRLVSLVMLKQSELPDALRHHNDTLISRLERLWPRLVELPPLPKKKQSDYPFDISIILPAYKEDGRELLTKLKVAHDTAATHYYTQPQPQNTTQILYPQETMIRMEVIIVNAGLCTDLEAIILEEKNNALSKFAKVQCVMGTGGGRGPSLNQGAALAQGRILTFLHADTRLVQQWNVSILEAFIIEAEDSPRITVNSCAFSFAIDTTPNGLNGGPYPPGIRAIERTANWRTHWFHLPYGDQCLSIPQHVFEFIGGFPDQCLMEDYELVRLLRQRVATLGERLAILELPAYCSPRRWQTLGVFYVTYTNSKCVNLYSRGDITPDNLFRLYYGSTQAPKRAHPTKSPWEVEMEQLYGLHKKGSAVPKTKTY
jgi:hypothetical protein